MNVTLDQFAAQMDRMRKIGSLAKVFGTIPGMSELDINMNEADFLHQMVRMRTIYDSMTRQERQKRDILEDKRRRRISCGAGVPVMDVGLFIRQFLRAVKMMDQG